MQENTEIILPNTIRGIAGTEIFKNQNNLVSITIPDKVKIIPQSTFSSCKNLKEVKFSSSLEIINKKAFMDCLSLESVVLYENVNYVGDEAFYGCQSLHSVKLGENITEIGPSAFAGCPSLERLVIPDGVTRLRINMILGTAVTWINLPKEMRTIEEISKNSPLTAVIVPKELAKLNYNYLYRNTKLNKVFFTGTEEEWKSLPKVENYQRTNFMLGASVDDEALKVLLAEWLEVLNVYFYSEEEPTEEGNFWHYVDGTPTKWE